MRRVITRLFALFLGMTILLTGNGLLGSLLGIRAVQAGFSGGLLGLIMSAYFAGFILGTFVCPRLIRRVGHIRTFAAFSAIAASAALGHALTLNPWLWLLLRLLSGVSMVSIYMVIESWLNATLTPDLRGRVFATYVTLTLVALAIGQFLLFIPTEHNFTLFALAAVFLAMGLVPVTTTRLVQPHNVETPSLQLKALFRLSPLATAGTFLSGLTTGAFWALGAAFLSKLGWRNDSVGLFMAIVIAGGIFLEWPIGLLSDRIGRRPVLVGTAACGVAASVVMALTLDHARWIFLLASGGFGATALTLYALSVAHMNDYAGSENALPVTQGLLLVVGIGSAIGPIFAGGMLQAIGPVGLPWYLATCQAILVVLGLIRISQKKAPPVEKQQPYIPLVRTSQAALELLQPAEDEAGAPASESTTNVGSHV